MLTAQAQGQVDHADEESFEQKVLKSEHPVLVDFYADWCGPCKALAPILEDVARESPHAKVVKVNVDHSPDLAAQYRIAAIPSLLVFKNGEVTAQHTGLASKNYLKGLLTR
jgi:thioredoxin 1